MRKVQIEVMRIDEIQVEDERLLTEHVKLTQLEIEHLLNEHQLKKILLGKLQIVVELVM